MNVTQEFLDSLSFSGGWKIETIGEKTFYTLTDPVYCQNFWVQYWYQIGYKNFNNQSFITHLADGNITQKVILDGRTGDLIMAPQGWNLIAYLGSFVIDSKPPIQNGMSGKFILYLYLVVFAILFILFIVFGRNDTSY
jgi:hypothetical protein